MKKPVCFFTIASDDHLKYYKMLEASFKKFHPDIPLILIGGETLKEYLSKDQMFYYRAAPIIARGLIDEYETVVKIDSDSIVTGKLNELWEETYDVGLVNNSNPREMARYPVSVWNLHPLAYVNAGFVVMKSKRFIEHWFNLCISQFFNNYQFKEQDLLNIIAFYGNYDVKFLDQGDSFYGLASKGYWGDIKMKGDDLFLQKNNEWPDKDKIIRVIHFAGGNDDPEKGNYRLHFQKDVIERINYLITP